MQFLSELRDRIRLRGEIHLECAPAAALAREVGGWDRSPPGHIVVTAVTEMSLEDVTPALVRRSGS